MTTCKAIRQELSKKMATPTMYKRMKAAKKKTSNSISNEIAMDVVASRENISVYDILKKEGRVKELKEFQETVSKFDFGSVPKKTPGSNQGIEKPKEERSPYDTPLTRYNLDEELTKDCKLQKPYRKAISEALLTLETRLRKILTLDESYYGKNLITEARNKGLFKRNIKSEEEGLFMLYLGSIEWLRNPVNHRKIPYTKEDALKIVLFTDYLIKLAEDLHNKP